MKYTWGEHALTLIHKAKEFAKDQSIFAERSFTVDLQAAAVLRMTGHADAHLSGYAHIAAHRHGVAVTSDQWQKTTDSFLFSLAGANSLSGSEANSNKLHGFSATFACGSRVDMHNLDREFALDAEEIKQGFKDCVAHGIENNKQLKTAKPTAKFLPEETVVRVTFKPVTRCYHQAFTKPSGNKVVRNDKTGEEKTWTEAMNTVYHKFAAKASGCATATENVIPTYLQKFTNEEKYRGLLLARDLPLETLAEVLLDPKDVTEMLG